MSGLIQWWRHIRERQRFFRVIRKGESLTPAESKLDPILLIEGLCHRDPATRRICEEILQGRASREVAVALRQYGRRDWTQSGKPRAPATTRGFMTLIDILAAQPTVETVQTLAEIVLTEEDTIRQKAFASLTQTPSVDLWEHILLVALQKEHEQRGLVWKQVTIDIFGFLTALLGLVGWMALMGIFQTSPSTSAIGIGAVLTLNGFMAVLNIVAIRHLLRQRSWWLLTLMEEFAYREGISPAIRKAVTERTDHLRALVGLLEAQRHRS